jgi:hypothetical protein
MAEDDGAAFLDLLQGAGQFFGQCRGTAQAKPMARERVLLVMLILAVVVFRGRSRGGGWVQTIPARI